LCAGRRADALHLTRRVASTVGVDLDVDLLTDAHLRELRLLEVCRYPGARVGHDRHQWLPRLHELSDLHLLARDGPTLRRGHGCVPQRECRVVTGSLGRIETSR